MVALLLMIGGIAFPIWLARRGASQRGVFFALAFVALLLGFACNSLSRSSLEEINSSDVSQRLGAELLRDSGTYFIAGYIGLFIGGVIAGLIWRSSADPKVDTLRPCPYCAEFIQPAAKVCKHCHREVSPHIVAEEAPTLTSLSAAKEVSDRRTSRFLIWAIAGFLLLLFLNGLRSKPSTSLTVAPVLNQQIRALADSEQVVLVDVYADLTQNVAGWMGPDGLHPTAAGYAEIAKTFAGRISATFLKQ